MDKCPLTGEPCPHAKCIHVTDCGPNYKLIGSMDMCVLCGTAQLDPQYQVSPLSTFVDTMKNVFGADVKLNTGTQQEEINPEVCPSCGWTVERLMETGRVGCANCYVYYKKILTPMIKKFHGTTSHVGKGPKNKEVEKEKLEIQLINLEVELADAIKKENYELAAKLRDQIKKLKQ